MTNTSPKTMKGRAMFQDITGLDANAFEAQFAGPAAKFPIYAFDWEFADLVGNSSLDDRSRELVAVASMASLGATAAPVLQLRIACARRAGISQQEIMDIFLQIGLAAGLPAALAAIKIAQGVFAQETAID